MRRRIRRRRRRGRENLLRIRSTDPSERWLADRYALQIMLLDTSCRESLQHRFISRRPTGFEALYELFKEIQTTARNVFHEIRQGDTTHRAKWESMVETYELEIESPEHWENLEEVTSRLWEPAIAECMDQADRRLEAGLRGCFFDNCEILGEALGFSELETRALAFVALSVNQQPLGEVVDSALGHLSLAELLQLVFGLQEHEAAKLVGDASPLVASGILRRPMDHENLGLAPPLAERLLEPHDSALALIQSLLTEAPAPELSMQDFEHLGAEGELLRAFVEGALAQGSPGVNIMLHGPPGTGKTQLVRALAASLGAALFEVPIEEQEGSDPLSGSERLSALMLGQRLVGKLGSAVMLFDEAEDLFPASGGMAMFGGLRLELSRQRSPKSFLNRALETTPTVTFWTTNAHQQIDPAHLRRFSLVLQLGIPPIATRRRMVDARLGDLGLSEATLGALSHEALAPSEIERLGQVVRISQGLEPERALAAALTMGSEPRMLEPAHEGPAYDVDVCATNEDLDALAAGLRRRKRGRLLLHGAPGTGKTAWARHLAERLELPLIHASGSSLLSKWVGDTEQRMAQLFADATRQDAIVFLDEADTFLRSRQTAQRHWQASQTNELLLQMERFQGIFLCATNMLDVFDPASLRRFDLKIHFEPPDARARAMLFQRTLESLDAAAAEPGVLLRLDDLDGLTPGDFATVARRASFLEHVPDAEWLVDALQEELTLRRDPHGRRVGFGR